jgi:hypothetical protein
MEGMQRKLQADKQKRRQTEIKKDLQANSYEKWTCGWTNTPSREAYKG